MLIRQKGTSLRLNDDGQAESVVIIRHLVLPGLIKNSIDTLNSYQKKFLRLFIFINVAILSYARSDESSNY